MHGGHTAHFVRWSKHLSVCTLTHSQGLLVFAAIAVCCLLQHQALTRSFGIIFNIFLLKHVLSSTLPFTKDKVSHQSSYSLHGSPFVGYVCHCLVTYYWCCFSEQAPCLQGRLGLATPSSDPKEWPLYGETCCIVLLAMLILIATCRPMLIPISESLQSDEEGQVLSMGMQLLLVASELIESNLIMM